MLSIITVVRNGARTIRTCLESVQRQTLSPEHIVVDGKSTDGTLDILSAAQKRDPRLVFVSEADTGIYDAMRKGIGRAQGDVIGCLNADDFYASPTVLEQVAQIFSDPTIDSCYGDLLYVRSQSADGAGPRLSEANGELRLPSEKVVRRWRAGVMSPGAFHWGWMPPHPTFFVRRSVYERHGHFRLDLGTSADYELMLRFLVKHRITTQYFPEVLVKMLVGGVSNASFRNRLLSQPERSPRLGSERPAAVSVDIAAETSAQTGAMDCYGTRD